MSYNQQQPLANTANTDTTGLAGPNANKTTLGNTNAGTTTGYGNATAAPGGGQGTGLFSSADNYNTRGTAGTGEGVMGNQVPVQQGPFGSGTGAEVRGNDGIAKPINWQAVNRGGGATQAAPYGLTGRAGHGGGVGAPVVEDLGAGNDPTNVMGPSSGFQDAGAGGYAARGANTHPNAGRHGAEAGVLAGGVHGHGQGHTVRDAAVGGAAGGAAGHEVHKHKDYKAEEGHTSLMDKVKNVLKPHHGGNTDPANTATNDNTGGNVGNVGGTTTTGTGPTSNAY